MTDTNALSALVASRICHDLISPIGAIGNGLELLHMSAASGAPAASEEMDLISDCAKTASESLQFMRIAFGSRPAEEEVPMREVANISAAYFGRRKVMLQWGELGTDAIRFRSAQILMMMALCAVSTMPRGGSLTLKSDQGFAWLLEGEGLRVTDRFLALMRNAPNIASLTPGEVHHAVLWEHLTLDGQRPEWQEMSEGHKIGYQPVPANVRKQAVTA